MIKTIAIALIISVSQFALAHELDEVSNKGIKPVVNADTLIVKTYKNDPSRVEVVKVSEAIPAGPEAKAKIAKLNFQQLAMKSELHEQNVTAANEKETVGSTSSWGWAGGAGIVVGPRGGIYGYRRGAAWGGGWGGGWGGSGYYGGYYPSYGYGYGNYGCAGYYNNYGGCYYAPRVYASSYYGYQPYYGYYDNDCYYTMYQGGYYY